MKSTSCPSCGVLLGTSGIPTTSFEIIEAIESLTPTERSLLRAKILARYDVSGKDARVKK